MTTKNKQKTRLSDLTPKKDARAGRLPIVNQGPASGIAPQPSASSTSKKHLIKFPPPPA